MRRTKRTLAVVALTLVSCSTPVVPASTPTSNLVTVRLYATSATIPLLNDLSSRYTEIYPSVTFETITGNFQSMLDRLIAGDTAYLLTNHLPEQLTLMAWPLGQDGIAVITQPNHPIANLTMDQLRGIYLGYISNWQEVGGPNREIVVISREDGSGTRAEFERLVMGERLTTRSAEVASSSEAMVASVAGRTGSIGYVSMSYLDERVRSIRVDGIMPSVDTVFENIYPLRTTLFIVGLTEPEDEYRALIGWLQGPDGQATVARRYSPLLRP